jgi:Tfp pilus assembly protein PilO
MKQLTKSEKSLAIIVGAVAFVLLNLLFVSGFVKHQAQLRADLSGKAGQLKALQVLFSERDRWIRRDEWLRQKQPKLANESGAGVQLLDQIKQIAKSNDVLLENPGWGAPEKSQFYRSVPVNIETKSSWPALIAFMRTVQQPDQFLVFEAANVQIDPGDPSMIRGKFKVARWYLP